MTRAFPSRSTTVVESGGGLTITVLRSVPPQAARARQASKRATAGRMAISLKNYSRRKRAVLAKVSLQPAAYGCVLRGFPRAGARIDDWINDPRTDPAP